PLTIDAALGDSSRDAGFQKATTPRPFNFPQDHGPHPEFRQEWWYVTGNLATTDGKRHFGYQWTLFRIGLQPDPPAPDASAWRTNGLYLGHLALSDIESGRFHHFQRLIRPALGMAGAEAEPFRVWLEDWSLAMVGGSQTQPNFKLVAAQEGIALDLKLDALKPVVLQGEQGLSRKSAEHDAASYYFSLTRLKTRGEIQVNGERHRVEGSSWFDREWSSSALTPEQAGWDWFALQLDDGRELMFYRMRLKNGQDDGASQGILIEADGRTVRLEQSQWRQREIGQWTSPKTGNRYPAGWEIELPDQGLRLEVIPRLADQELANAALHYWEGAVTVQGRSNGMALGGVGYVELTGYGVARP
ncbi:MAG: carotenoid 1,2-hydratase, partial [Magnetococcales bacterium]|nr:carotenoid 1,2-hydratase [Magnetococcales bacterium]